MSGVLLHPPSRLAGSSGSSTWGLCILLICCIAFALARPSPAQTLVVDGQIESTSGGVKYPDASEQTTAFGPSTVGSAEIIDGSILGSDVDTSFNGVQRRVGAICPLGQAIREITEIGGIDCEDVTSKGWFRGSVDFACPDGNNCSLGVICPGSTNLLGGGVEIVGLPLADAGNVLLSQTFPSADNVWTAVIANASGASQTMRVWAICADN